MSDQQRTASARSPRDVLESHLQLSQAGRLEEDLERNYADDVVLLSYEGINRGHDGVRRLAAVLRNYVDAGHYSYDQILVEGDVAMMRWHAADGDTVVHDGADSYVISDGRIRAQTIHFSARSRRS
jgi:hypothetical protein